MSSSGTVWDYDPSIPAEGDPVTGKTEGGPSVSFFADLMIQIGNLASAVKSQQDRWDRWANSQPGDYQNAAEGAFPSSGNLMLDLGGPDQGQWWDVRRLIVGGSDITATPPGTAWVVVVGGVPTAAGNVGLAQIADFTSGTLPQKAFYGTHELVVTPGEHLYVVVSGGTSGVQYVASCKCEVYDQSQRPAGFIE